MSRSRRPRVAYVFPISHRFRAAFHEQMRCRLDAVGIDYDYVHTEIDLDGKGDTTPINWGTQTKMYAIQIGSRRLAYQAALRATWGADLVILQQENGLLCNYPIQVLRRLFRKKVAFFGHGRNFQAANSDSLAERFKRFWTDKVDWWFAYTDRSAEIVAASGFPRERITVFNNAIDTSAIRAELASISQDEQAALRETFGGSDNIGIYVGGLYDRKRIPFLIEAARAVRARVPDFQLLVVGGGVEAPRVQAAAAETDWIHALGPRFGREKTLLASLGKVFLMPGLVGLGVLDSFAYGTPMVTTDLTYHSPEIDYLKDGVNGVVVCDSDSVEAYAAAVARVLTDDAWRARLRAGAAEALETYTVENMAERFAVGVVRALRAR